jgi:hypothetical protein
LQNARVKYACKLGMNLSISSQGLPKNEIIMSLRVYAKQSLLKNRIFNHAPSGLEMTITPSGLGTPRQQKASTRSLYGRGYHSENMIKVLSTTTSLIVDTPVNI